MTTGQVVVTGLSRVFLVEGRARVDHQPTYQSCMKAGGLDWGQGDIERIECPDPNSYGKFVKVGEVKGAIDQVTTTLTGRYALDTASEMLSLTRQGCPVDAQVHFGLCTDPSVFGTFKKALVLENAQITNYSTEDLGALSSDENAKVDESIDISADSAYEIMPVEFQARAGDLVTNEVLDVVICDAVSCGGDCQAESGGCEKIYAVTKGAGGSAGTPPDVVFTIDGVNWYAHDIDSIATAVDAVGVACLGDYLLAIATNATYPLNYTLKNTVTPTVDPAWTAITTGFVAAGTPRAIWSSGTTAFIVGSAGYIYSTTDPTAGVTVLDAGVAAAAKPLQAVHGLSNEFVVAVGQSGAIVKTEDGVTWGLVTPINIAFGATDFRCVLLLSEDVWLLGTDAGRLYYTVDGGVTFYEKSFSGSGSGVVWDITQSTDSVLWMSHATAANIGRVFRSYDAGYSWVLMPDTGGTMPQNDRYTALAACEQDPNLLVAVGLGDNGTDGVILVGQA